MDRMSAPKSNSIQFNPFVYWTVSKPKQIKSRVWMAARREQQTTRCIGQNNDRYLFIYIYEFFYIFSSNRNTIPNDFFFFFVFIK